MVKIRAAPENEEQTEVMWILKKTDQSGKMKNDWVSITDSTLLGITDREA